MKPLSLILLTLLALTAPAELPTAGKRFFPIREVDPGNYGALYLPPAATRNLPVTHGTWNFGAADETFTENRRSAFAWAGEQHTLNLADQTLSGWFTVDNQQPPKEIHRLLCMRTATANAPETQCAYRLYATPDGRLHLGGHDPQAPEVVTRDPVFQPGRWVHIALTLGDTPGNPKTALTLPATLHINGQPAPTHGQSIPRRIPGERIALLRVGDDDVYSAGIEAHPRLLPPDRIIQTARATPSHANRQNLIRLITFNTPRSFTESFSPGQPASPDLAGMTYRPTQGRHGSALGPGSTFTVTGATRDTLAPPHGPWSLTLRARISDNAWQTLPEPTPPHPPSAQSKTIIACGDTATGWHLRANRDRSITLTYFTGAPADTAPHAITLPGAIPAFGTWIHIALVRTPAGAWRLHATAPGSQTQTAATPPHLTPAPNRGPLTNQGGLTAEGDALDDLAFWHTDLLEADIDRLAATPQSILIVTTPEVTSLDLSQLLPALTETLTRQNITADLLPFNLTPSLRAGHTPFDRGRLQHLLNSNPAGMVIGLNHTSARFIRANLDLLPPDTSTIFIASPDDPPPAAASLIFPNVLNANIDQAFRLYPQATRLLIIAPYPIDLTAPAVTVKTRFELTEEKLLETIAALPPETILLFSAWNDPTLPQAFNTDLTLLQKITTLTRNPILTLNSRLIGPRGATGGFILSSRHAGSALGDIALEILNGTPPAAIPPTRLTLTPTFDTARLQTSAIKLHTDHLPGGAVYIGDHSHFLERYLRELAIGLGMFLSILLCMLAFTWINIRRRIRTQTLLQALPIQIIMISPENRILPRPAEAGLLGHKSQPLNTLSPHILAALEPAIVSVRQSGKPAAAEFTNASGRHMRGECTPLPHTAYPPGTLLWVATDVHELHTAKIEALNTSALLHSLSNNMPGMLFVKDADNAFRYVMSNNAFAQALNQTTETIIGKDDFLIFTHREEAAECRRGDERALLISGVSESQETIHLANGARITAHVLKQTIRMSNGHRYILGMGTDITRIIEMENTLRAHIEQEQRINANLQAVISGQSEETLLNTTLSALGHQRGARHSALFLFTPGRTHFHCQAGWNPNGAPLTNTTTRYPIDPANTWIQTLVEDRPVTFALADTSPYSPLKDLPHFTQTLRNTGADTVILIGVRGESSLLGFIGLACASENTNQAAIIHFIRSTAHVLELFYARQRAQQQLLQSERDKRLILDTIQIPVLLFDNRLRLTHLNSAATAFAADLIKQRSQENPPAADPPAAIALKTGKSSESNMTLGGKDYQVMAIPVIVENQIVNIVETAYDVTQFNEAQRSLRHAMEATQAAARAKSFFIATISHELRTPLNAVIGFSELMQNTTLTPEEQHSNLEAINIAGKTLLTLINDILDLSRLEAEQVEIIKAPMDLSHMLHELKLVFKAACLKKGITLQVVIPPGLPHFELDQIRIRQVLFNIVGNAVKFTTKGSVTVGITCHYTDPSRSHATLRIDVADTGPGIDPQFRETIFEPFGQKNHVRGNTVYEGSGLGLSITRRLLTCMDGALTLESQLGKGSTFTIQLQNVACLPPDTPTAPPPPLQELPPPQDPPPPPPATHPQKGAILIVDDVPMNLKVLGAMLTRLHRPYISATSGQEALDLAKTHQPSLILTDLWMPGMNGDELARRLQDQTATSKIPILALTADTQFDLQDSPFAHVLFKPLTLDKISAILQKY